MVLCIFLVAGIGGYEWRSQTIAAQPHYSQTTLDGQLEDFIKIENTMLNEITPLTSLLRKKMLIIWNINGTQRKLNFEKWMAPLGRKLVEQLTLY